MYIHCKHCQGELNCGEGQQPGEHWGRGTSARVSLGLAWAPWCCPGRGLWGRDPQNPPEALLRQDGAGSGILASSLELPQNFPAGMALGSGAQPCVLWCLLSPSSPGSASRCQGWGVPTWAWGVLAGLEGLCRAGGSVQGAGGCPAPQAGEWGWDKHSSAGTPRGLGTDLHVAPVHPTRTKDRQGRRAATGRGCS